MERLVDNSKPTIRVPTQVTIFSTNPGNPAERNFCMEIMSKFPLLNGKVLRVMPKPSAAQQIAA